MFSRCWAAFQGLECYRNYFKYCLLGQQECVRGDLTLYNNFFKTKIHGGRGGVSNDHPGTASDFIYVQVDCIFQTSQMEKCATTIMNIACKSVSSDTNNTMGEKQDTENYKNQAVLRCSD